MGELLDRLIQGGLILLLVFSILAFGAVSGWGLAIAILLAAGLIFCWACRMAAEGKIHWHCTPLDKAFLGGMMLVLVQMAIGFPWGWSGNVSPEGILTRATERPGHLPFVPGTLDFHATQEAFVLFLCYAGVFYLVVHCVKSRQQMDSLLTSLTGLAAVVAFYGLVEFLSGNRGIFGWKGYSPGRLSGTLVNPDHFAAYLGMVIPVAAGFLIGSGARRRRRRSIGSEDPNRQAIPESTRTKGSEQPGPSLFGRHSSSGTGNRESRRLLVSLSCVLGIVALFFTISRGGITSFLVGGLFFVALLWIREPDNRRRLGLIGVGVAAAALIAWTGVEPILVRFGALDLGWATRKRIYWDVLAMVRDFPILGTGLGTFDRIFPRYSSPEFTVGIHLSHAHSEPLQLATEGGVIAVLILIFALVALMRDLLLRRLFGLVRGRNAKPEIRNLKAEIEVNSKFEIRNSKLPEVRRDPYNVAIAFGCLSSVIVIFLHSFFEFPLRVPANGILLATILGIAVVSVGMRFRPEGAQSLLPGRVLVLSRRGRVKLVVGAGALSLFMAWTAIAGTAAQELADRGYEIIGEGSRPNGPDEKPWIMETKRNREALGNLRLAVRLDPLNAGNHYRLGRLYEQLALRTWNAGLSEEGRFIPDNPSRARIAEGSLDEAMRQYATAILLARPYSEAWGRLGGAFGVRHQMTGVDPVASGRASADIGFALAGMRQAIALNPNSWYRHDVLAAFGFARLGADRPASEAISRLDDPIVQEGVRAQQRAVELNPSYMPEALERMLRYTQDAAELVRTIPVQAPDSLFAARLLEERELWPQAMMLFRRAIELAPDDGKPLYYREYAEALTRRGKDAEVEDILRVVLRFDPGNLDLRLALANTLYRLKQDIEALAAYQEALVLARGLDDARPTSAVPSGVAKRPVWLSREERVFELIRGRFPVPRRTADPLTKALGALAAFYHDQKRDDLAVPLWEKAVARTPDDAPTVFGLARSYDAVGAWMSASDAYKRVIELDRGNLEFRLALADRYFENDMMFQAINLWRDVLAVRPTLVGARLNLAAAYTRLEQYPDAKREYERVLQLQPGNASARAGLQRLGGRPSGT